MSSFDLEHAIREWRRKLRKQQGLEPGMIEELEMNLLDRMDEYMIKGYSGEEAFRKAAEKSLGDDDGEAVADEFFKTRTPFYKQTPPWKGKASLVDLLPSYLKVAVRNFQRKGAYTAINYIGLTVGLLTACFVGLYIHYELSWDDFHTKSDRIVRIGQEFRSQSYSLNAFDGYRSASRETQLNQIAGFENVPGVQDVAHFWIFGGASFLTIGDRRYSEDGLLTTNTPAAFFNLFDRRFIHGSAENFSSTPNRAVLTESTAEMILSRDELSLSDLVGQTFVLDSTNYEISGIIEDIPENSHYEFKIALHDPRIEYWGGRTYALLEEGVSPQTVKQRWDDNISEINARLAAESDLFKGFVVRPLESLHLYGDDLYELKIPGNPRYLWIFGIIGLVILLITLTNYTNLSIAMYSGRNREIGMRKVMGAGQWQVALQFLMESVILALFTLPVVLGLVTWLIPYFNKFMDVSIENLFLSHMSASIILLIAVLLFGFASGLYPALTLSGRNILVLFNKQMTRP